MERTIRECPFCGGKAEIIYVPGAFGKESVYITCQDCRSKSPQIYVDAKYCAKDKVIEAWNRRTEHEDTNITINVDTTTGIDELCRIMRKIEEKFLRERKPPYA